MWKLHYDDGEELAVLNGKPVPLVNKQKNILSQFML